jgi:hypothetical protein
MTTAQTSYPSVISPDPVSAGFQKYLSYPVSYATGLTQISIPLYTMNTSGVSIPFSLSYHASGIKVEQEMGHIGLGWSLFPGCKISRNIMGKPDDRYPTNDIRDLKATNFNDYAIYDRYTNDGNLITPSPYFDYLFSIVPHSEDDPAFSASTTAANLSFDKIDTQHDIFTLHLPNKNVTFIVEWLHGSVKATTIPESSIKIDLVGLDTEGHFTSFEVTDENGIVYTFGNSGETGYTEHNESYNSDITSWLLKTIDPPGVNNSIRFYYNDTQGKYSYAKNTTTIEFRDEIQVSSVTNTSYNVLDPTLDSNKFNYPQYYTITTLDNIVYDTGETIDFTYSTISGYMYDALDNITFKNKNDVVVKTVGFERDNKQLIKLNVSGEGAYQFVYDEQDLTPPSGKYYVGSDFLGLFNGQFGVYGANPKMYLYYNSHNLGGPSTELPRLVGDIDIKSQPVNAQARILKNIIYPTGGQTSFEYEPNIYSTDEEGVVSGMGLRIKEIDTYDPISKDTLTKSYKYGKKENGIGYCNSPYLSPPFDGIYDDGYRDETGRSYTGRYIDAYVSQTSFGKSIGISRLRVVGSTANTGIISDPIIWYDEVVEYSNGGKTIYNYEFTPTEYTGYRDEGFTTALTQPTYINTIPIKYFPNILRNVGNSSPKLIRKEIKDNHDITLQITDYNYSSYIDNTRRLLGIYSNQNFVVAKSWLEVYHISGTDSYNLEGSMGYGAVLGTGLKNKVFNADNYYLEINNQKLISTKQTDYRKGEAIVNETTFVYDDMYKFNLKSKTVTTSDNGTLTEKYYYPVGDVAPDLDNLTNSQKNMMTTFATSKNYQGRVIEKEVYKNGSVLLNKELYGYKDWGNSIYKIENVFTKKNEASNFVTPFTIESYDDKGNITDISKQDGTHTAYIWGYNKQYPVAKIENITPTQKTVIQNLFATAEDTSDLDISEVSNNKITENNLRSSLEVIRNDGVLSNAMISTYTYDPQIGITSKTDQRGYTTYYNYNSDFKLEAIKDKDENFLQEYRYNYIPFGTNEPIDVPMYSGDLNSGGGETLLDKPSFSLSVNSYDFGERVVGSSTEFIIRITNTTPSTYTTNNFSLDSISLPDGFVLISKPLHVFRGTSANIVIAFEPTAVTNYVGTTSYSKGVAFYINGSRYSGTPLLLSGEGIANNNNNNSGILDITDSYGATINTLDFGTVSWEDYSTKYFRIYNKSTDTPLTISGITQSDAYGFLFTDIQIPITIQPNSYISYGIDFLPGNGFSVGQQVSEFITFQSSDGSSNNTLQLIGFVTE